MESQRLLVESALHGLAARDCRSSALRPIANLADNEENRTALMQGLKKPDVIANVRRLCLAAPADACEPTVR